VFISDNQAYPYGTKSEVELLARITDVGRAIYQTYQPDILVLACNTASTIGLPLLRDLLNIPVVGVVPAIKPAAVLSRSKVIGLLATPATIKRDYTLKLIEDFASDCDVVKVGSRDLVDLAEAKLSGQVVTGDDLTDILAPFTAQEELDVLVLACTHFPLLENEIAQVFQQNNREILLIDSGAAIANRVTSLNSVSVTNNQQNNKPEQTAVFTQALAASPNNTTLEHNLKAMGFDRIELLDVISH